MEKSEAHQLYLEPSLILRTYRFLHILFVINVHPGEILFTSRSPLNKALLFRLKFPGSLKERNSEFQNATGIPEFQFRNYKMPNAECGMGPSLCICAVVPHSTNG